MAEFNDFIGPRPLRVRTAAGPMIKSAPALNDETLRRDCLPFDLCSSALHQVDVIGRRIDQLASRLNVLGYFDADDDRPRAA